MDVSGEHEIFASKRKDCLLLIAVAIKYQHFFFFFVPVLQAPISIEQHTEGHTIHLKLLMLQEGNLSFANPNLYTGP